MNDLVLFGVGSPIVVEYEETCRRLGYAIVAGVQNRPGTAYFHGAIVDARAVPAALLNVGCVCPLFTPNNRIVACAEAVERGFRFAEALIDPTAIVASSATIGAGSFVNAGSIVGAQTVLAEHVVVNRGTGIGHDVEIGAFASLGPGVVVCGEVTIGTGAMIGARAVLLPRVKIGAHAVVAAGSVVVADVLPNAKVFGSPARAKETSAAAF
jgi:sugar O-acyltransferase (sialic acid O-acetyltransferase NeuD family)